VAAFADLTDAQAESALGLAEDLGLIGEEDGSFRTASPLAQFLAHGGDAQRAVILRLLLESYEPFRVFRDRLLSTNTVATAATQTRAILDLDAHREEIKDTLLSLGTFSQALAGEGGARYLPVPPPAPNMLEHLAASAEDHAAAEARIREQLGADVVPGLPLDTVIQPLADALLRASQGDGRGAVVAAGNAVESFLSDMGARGAIDLSHAHGINAKVRELKDAGVLPEKVAAVGRYLGHIRNGADHGVDPEVGTAWSIRPSTGVEVVFVATSFISICCGRESGGIFEL
jgi:hypothetical protein